ncbi:uracil-DNA glycosylase family protein [Viridibacillus arvi]|uniref:uracil-DNA glycosylase family protein n=1 Tax=Viridibacillus arvi TaxID=263475 RepID=UPI00382E2D64
MPKKVNEIHNLISLFEEQIKEWNVEHKKLNFVFNQELYLESYDCIKYIVVGDNPGVTELEQGKYLVGVSGFSFRSIMKGIFSINDFKNEVLVLNKTPIFSKQTEELNLCLKGKIRIQKKAQKEMAQLIYNLQKGLNCKVIIIGKGAESLNSRNKVLGEFYNRISSFGQKDLEFKNSVYQFNHISNNQFAKQIIKDFPNTNDWTEENILSIGKREGNKIFR